MTSQKQVSKCSVKAAFINIMRYHFYVFRMWNNDTPPKIIKWATFDITAIDNFLTYIVESLMEDHYEWCVDEIKDVDDFIQEKLNEKP